MQWLEATGAQWGVWATFVPLKLPDVRLTVASMGEIGRAQAGDKVQSHMTPGLPKWCWW